MGEFLQGIVTTMRMATGDIETITADMKEIKGDVKTLIALKSDVTILSADVDRYSKVVRDVERKNDKHLENHIDNDFENKTKKRVGSIENRIKIVGKGPTDRCKKHFDDKINKLFKKVQN